MTVCVRRFNAFYGISATQIIEPILPLRN